MNYIIKKLSPEMANDYVDFFDKRGLIDGDINKGCYCVWHHWTDLHELNRNKLPENERPLVKKQYAIKLIKEGKLNGFVAYLNDKIVGFCNADNKENYFRLNKTKNPDLWVGLNDDDLVMAIVCFVVDVNIRGKGVATALLKGVCEYAVQNRYTYVEAYPSTGLFDPYECGGPLSMYEKQDFLLIDNKKAKAIVRKKVI